VFFEIAVVIAGDGQTPVPERLARTAVAALAEQGGNGAAPPLCLGISDLAKRLIDECIEAARPVGQGVFDPRAMSGDSGSSVTARATPAPSRLWAWSAGT